MPVHAALRFIRCAVAMRHRQALSPAGRSLSSSAGAFSEVAIAQLFGGVADDPDTGTVVDVKEDAVVRSSGLRAAHINGVVSFVRPGMAGAEGFVVDLEHNTVAVALLDRNPTPSLNAASELSDQPLEIPVGDALLGRVVDPVGRPLAHLDPLEGLPLDNAGQAGRRKSLGAAPLGIMARKPLCRHLATGIKAVDVFHPIGHGQCIVVIGQRGAGKTSLALQTLINSARRSKRRAEGDMFRCVYVAIGQEDVVIQRTVEQLREADALSYTAVIAAPASSPPGLRFVAPFAGCAVGEHWRDQGALVLVVLDDLTRHEEAYGEIARFASKPQSELGLSLHGPLLERFAQLSDARGGGAMTGLVIVEGEAAESVEGSGSAGHSGLPYVLQSVADHTINLSLDMARKKVFPAVDVTYQMNMQSPGAALVREPIKSLVQSLRVAIAHMIDDEMSAFHAEQLGIKREDEEVERAERIEYLAKIRELFRQNASDAVNEKGLLLFLLAACKGLLRDLNVDAIKQLDHVLTHELPSTKGWQKLSAELDAVMTDPAKVASPPDSPGIKPEDVYERLMMVLRKAVAYSRKKSQIAAMVKKQELAAAAQEGGDRLDNARAAVEAYKRRKSA